MKRFLSVRVLTCGADIDFWKVARESTLWSVLFSGILQQGGRYQRAFVSYGGTNVLFGRRCFHTSALPSFLGFSSRVIKYFEGLFCFFWGIGFIWYVSFVFLQRRICDRENLTMVYLLPIGITTGVFRV